MKEFLFFLEYHCQKIVENIGCHIFNIFTLLVFSDKF